MVSAGSAAITVALARAQIAIHVFIELRLNYGFTNAPDLLVSNRLSKTTGQVITVDGGLHEAFLR